MWFLAPVCSDHYFNRYLSDRLCLGEGYALSRDRVPRRGGARYEISPYLLTWEDGYYYMVGYDAAAGTAKHFRVDKMSDVVPGASPRDGAAWFAGFDPA